MLNVKQLLKLHLTDSAATRSTHKMQQEKQQLCFFTNVGH